MTTNTQSQTQQSGGDELRAILDRFYADKRNFKKHGGNKENAYNQAIQEIEARQQSTRMDIQMLNDNIVYAERYAIHRGSYANGSVADDIRRLIQWNILYPKTIAVLVRDIREALEEGLPYVDQQEKWTDVLQQLQPKPQAGEGDQR